MAENILTEAYLKGLHYVWYNGPPETIYAYYHGDHRTEKGIIEVLKTCGANQFNHIINPSEKVQVAAVTLDPWLFDKITKITKPSKPVIMAYLKQHGWQFKNYCDQLTEADLLELLAVNPDIYSKIDKPTDEMTRLAVSKKPELISSIERQNLSLCLTAVKQIQANTEQKITVFWGRYAGIVANLQFINQEIVEAICDTPYLAWQIFDNQILVDNYFNQAVVCRAIKNLVIGNMKAFNKVPKQYYCPELFNLAFQANKEIIQFIPHQYQTDDMIAEIYRAYDFIYKPLIKYLRTTTADTYSALFAAKSSNLVYIPAEYQNVAMCEKAVADNYRLLLDCAIITPNMLQQIFKSRTNVPRKERWHFIRTYPASVICKILAANGDLLKVIEQPSDEMIRAALFNDGYAIQHLTNKTPEYLELALTTTPNVINKLSLEDLELLQGDLTKSASKI